MENPGYIGARLVFEAAGAKISAVRLDDEGMKVRGESLRGSRLIYVTPGHQFPLGITMSLARRLELLEWARKSGAMIFEDDYDSEYRYSGPPIPALQGFDRNGLVIFAGSFSKVLFPSLRLGYLVIPPDLIARFAAAISLTTRHAPVLEQAVLCDFITEGHFGRHLRRMREVYAERLSVLLEAAREKLAGLLEISADRSRLADCWMAVRRGRRRIGYEGGGGARRRSISTEPIHARQDCARGIAVGFCGGGRARNPARRSRTRGRVGSGVKSLAARGFVADVAAGLTWERRSKRRAYKESRGARRGWRICDTPKIVADIWAGLSWGGRDKPRPYEESWRV